MSGLSGKRLLLIVSGGIAAYKALEFIRLARAAGAAVRCVLTRGGSEFVTALSLQALSEEKVYTDLFDLTDESEMGHIQLSRSADLLLVAPASADILARMTAGLADDLATTVLLATDTPVMVAPAMNVRMWEHPATQANLAILQQRGVTVVGPDEGEMACGEYGPGRMAEPADILAAVEAFISVARTGPLTGRRALVTSGPTHEAIDPVRYIANKSSGKQGHAIAEALARAGADTVLVSGPTALTDPAGVRVLHIESARDMLAAVEAERTIAPLDIAVCAAAVADWRTADAEDQKLKKSSAGPPGLSLVENPDILATLSAKDNRRPRLVVGFAAETEAVVEHAAAKRARKGCDWILANDVSAAANLGAGTFGGDRNTVTLVTAEGADAWPAMSKVEVANRLTARIAAAFSEAAE
ncbi:MAG: bifunctional phosphopantothenoylcysteine decarboxylase/phosphopantothenate--cysteine ligase CoaBC [Alphaproteobacteria bacterium]|nr:bifunctional phosphopantothenoylcysteine decarboxylase/phosphopantothenate--cysteine ligase CoaBC [Alphaproteobacteria bacterium]